MRFLICLLFALPTCLSADILEIGSRLEPLLDRALIAETMGSDLRLHPPRDEGSVLTFDQPWEGPFCGYCTVIQDGDRFRLYYRGKQDGGPDGSNEFTCYAESRDGKSWTKPSLDLEGCPSKSNVLLKESGVTHNFSPFLDTRPGVPNNERFKALGGITRKSPDSGLLAFTSEDGVHWRRYHPKPVLTKGAFDSQNVAFWSQIEGCYVAYFRTFTGGTTTSDIWKPSGLRTFCRATSADFLHWTEATPVSFRPPQEHHLYTSQSQPYFRAPHLIIATAARFLPGKNAISETEAQALRIVPSYYKSAKDSSDCVLMTSRDGLNYEQTFQEALIPPGLDLSQWVSRTGYPALNLVQTGPSEMSLYTNQNYAQPTAHLRRYSWRLDGLASMHAPYSGGEFTTKPIRFRGKTLHLNVATSAAGYVRVEIQDETGRPIPNRSLADAAEFFGNRIDHQVQWKKGADLYDLSGHAIRLRFVMKDADIYSLQFAP